MIKNIEDYFFVKGCGRCDRFATSDCSTQRWKSGLERLRRICLGVGLDETVKWGQPCYMFANRNIAIIGALRGDFRLSFFNPGLMQDPEQILEKAGPNSQYADMIRFTETEEVSRWQPILESYLKEAKGYAERGIKQTKEKVEFELPTELRDAFAADPELAAAFSKLTRGRQRSYVINLNSAKKPETRISRITKFRSKIIAGKGALER